MLGSNFFESFHILLLILGSLCFITVLLNLRNKTQARLKSHQHEGTNSKGSSEADTHSTACTKCEDSKAGNRSALVQGCRLYRERGESALILESAFGLPRSIAVAAGQLVDLANRDFVASWYSTTSPDPEFLEDTRLIMLDIVGGFVIRLCKLDFAQYLVRDVAPILRRNVALFHRIRFEAAKLDPEAFSPALEPDYARREAALVDAGIMFHPGASDDGHHIQIMVGKVLDNLLPPKDRECLALYHLIREIIVRSVILPVLESLHPYCLNSGLVSVGKSEVHEDGRAVDALKAGAASFLEDSDVSTIDEEPTTIAFDGLNNMEENYFSASKSKPRNSPAHSASSDINISQLRVLRGELALDYTDPQEPVPYMAYVIEVKALEKGTEISWIERTRYSRLKKLHDILTGKYPAIIARFPAQRGWRKYLLGLAEFDKSFVDSRVRELNEYVAALLLDPYIRDSSIIRKFFIASGYQSRHPIKSEASENVSSVVEQRPATVSVLDSGKLSSADLSEVYNLVEEIFLLDKGSFSFFRANIISFVRIIVRTAFKGSLFNHLNSLSEHRFQAIADSINAAREGTWPNGKLAPPLSIPPEDIQNQARAESLSFLKSALPKQVVSLIGEEHRDMVADQCHEMLQYHTFVKSIFLEIADVLVKKLFPESFS